MTDRLVPDHRPNILVADDQPDVLDAIRLLLGPEGFAVSLVRSPAAVLELLAEREFDVILMDLNYARDTTSGREGLDLLSRVHAADPHLPIVVMTGWGTMEIAIEAMRGGVRDFIQKPWDNERVIAIVRNLAEARRGERERAVRRAREWDQAREMQRSLLPRRLPAPVGWTLAAACEEAASVGGDTYDVVSLGDRRVAICIGDVAGKGIPAALLATNLQAAVRATLAADQAPAAVCEQVNLKLCETVPPGRFVTFFCAVIDIGDGTVTYCNAGHNPPLIARSDGSTVALSGGGLVLGLDKSWQYREDAVVLEPGDTLVLYTDGVTEARNALDEEFGEATLRAILSAHRAEPASGVLERVLSALHAFSGDLRHDDCTLVVASRTRVP